jgi:hypothetical protein
MVSYQRAALGNSAPGFDGTAAKTLMSSLEIASLHRQQHKHSKWISQEKFAKFEAKTTRSLKRTSEQADHHNSANNRESRVIKRKSMRINRSYQLEV